MPLIEVKECFLRDETKQAELEVFLSAQDSRQIEVGVIEYGGGIGLVRVHFSKKGKMTSIQCQENYSDRLKKQIEEAIYTDHGTDVGMRIIFTNIKIGEQFRHKDDFQIIPVPDGSPQVDTISGDHPALLEFSYKKSPHKFINTHRRTERIEELSFLLSAFIFYGIKWINNHADKYWVLENPEQGAWTSVYRQEMYTCEQWEQKDELGFSAPKNIPEMPLMESNAYFGQRGIGVGMKFHLPAHIVDYLKKYNSLNENHLEMTRLSAYWLQRSSLVQSASFSLSFSALVFALESLIHSPKKKGDCEHCGQVIYEMSISKCFRELIDTYATGIPKEKVNRMYDLRSAIAHGSDLIPRDKGSAAFRFTAPLIRSDSDYRETRQICQVVFLNWLMSRR